MRQLEKELVRRTADGEASPDRLYLSDEDAPPIEEKLQISAKKKSNVEGSSGSTIVPVSGRSIFSPVKSNNLTFNAMSVKDWMRSAVSCVFTLVP